MIDPPFVTPHVWELYAQAARMLLPSDGTGVIIGTTLFENGPLLHELFAAACAEPVRPRQFLPEVPHLPYQYRLYCNLAQKPGMPLFMDVRNPEIDADPELEGWETTLREYIASGGVDAEVGQHSGVQPGEATLSGAGNSADFVAMLEAALRQSA